MDEYSYELTYLMWLAAMTTGAPVPGEHAVNANPLYVMTGGLQ